MRGLSATGEPMTTLVDIALAEFIGRYKPPTEVLKEGEVGTQVVEV